MSWSRKTRIRLFYDQAEKISEKMKKIKKVWEKSEVAGNVFNGGNIGSLPNKMGEKGLAWIFMSKNKLTALNICKFGIKCAGRR